MTTPDNATCPVCTRPPLDCVCSDTEEMHQKPSRKNRKRRYTKHRRYVKRSLSPDDSTRTVR